MLPTCNSQAITAFVDLRKIFQQKNQKNNSQSSPSRPSPWTKSNLQAFEMGLPKPEIELSGKVKPQASEEYVCQSSCLKTLLVSWQLSALCHGRSSELLALPKNPWLGEKELQQIPKANDGLVLSVFLERNTPLDTCRLFVTWMS